MGKVCVVGSLNMDLSIVAEQMPVAGETITGRDFQMLPGGKGLNQAVAASRLGGTVRLIGALGADTFGQELQAFVTNEKIDAQGIKRSETKTTGTATILIENGDNRIIIYPGANEDVTPTVVKESETLIMTSDVIIGQLEVPLASTSKAFQLAKEAGKTTIFNPAPIKPITPTVFEMVDILVVNESECYQLTQIQVTTAETAAQAIAKLQALQVKQVVITLGGAGVYFINGAHVAYRPAHQVDVVDTTGAGDTFIGALASTLSDNIAFEQAIEFAITASALAVTKRGAATAIPTAAEVHAFCETAQ